jgi:hypothetical protein
MRSRGPRRRLRAENELKAPRRLTCPTAKAWNATSPGTRAGRGPARHPPHPTRSCCSTAWWRRTPTTWPRTTTSPPAWAATNDGVASATSTAGSPCRPRRAHERRACRPGLPCPAHPRDRYLHRIYRHLGSVVNPGPRTGHTHRPDQVNRGPWRPPSPGTMTTASHTVASRWSWVRVRSSPPRLTRASAFVRPVRRLIGDARGARRGANRPVGLPEKRLHRRGSGLDGRGHRTCAPLGSDPLVSFMRGPVDPAFRGQSRLVVGAGCRRDGRAPATSDLDR